MTDYLNVVYSIYLVFITGATIYVGRTLFNHSKVFMETIFNGRSHLAQATNRLFEMGFFLLAFGIGFFLVKENNAVTTTTAVFERLSAKAGGFTLFLGGLLLFNLYMFFRGMKYRNRNSTTDKITENKD
jgi:hypothetical protein